MFDFLLRHFAVSTGLSILLLSLSTGRNMRPAIAQQELRRLAEIYATRTRELSEALAILGGQIIAGGEIYDIVTEIKRLSRLVEEAGEALFAFVEPPPKSNVSSEDSASS
jgi:LmbE family N-acetylglucosaminyl deacetylase